MRRVKLRIGKGSLSCLSYASLALTLLLLVPSPFVSMAQATTANSSQYADHGFAALEAGDRVTLSSLETWTGGNLSVGAFERVIRDVFLPLNVREVLLDIGWQNFTAGSPPYQAWVNDWFTASDVMGVSNVLYVGQLTSEGFGSPWVNSLINKDPTVATYYANGTRADFVSLDNPEVARHIETDLGILYSYYGSHPSWVGLGTGSSQTNPYYAADESMPDVGYSNLSISSFVDSPYYSADVNGTGYLPNGELDALWSEFRNVQPAIVLSSGLWMTSSSYQVYGGGSSSSLVGMRFEVPSSTTTLRVQWYGNEVGSPGSLSVTIFGDENGRMDSSEELASLNASASSFTNSRGWQSGVQANGNFSAGWYWVVFSSPSSNVNNYYTFYLKDYLINNATAYAAQPAIGPGFQTGLSTILWLKNQAGENLVIYPYQQTAVGAPAQEFTATRAYSFNTVFLFLSDRAYNPANATLTITDTTDGKIVATGLLSQTLTQGLENWVPIALNATVTTVPGQNYLIKVDDPSVTWTTVMRYTITDPPQAGFQNQTNTLLFELAYVAWSQGLENWGGVGSNGGSAIKTGFMDAVRFSPSDNETVKSVQILMDSSQGVAQNYTSGTVSVAIWGSNPDGSAPEEPRLQQVNVQATRIPYNGFLTASGFNTTVTAGKDYWIVFSANSTEKFTFGRMTSAFEFLVLVSGDGGASWGNPADGPTEFAFTVTLSKETLGTFVSGEIQTPLTSNSIFAQPFVASSDASVGGVYIGPLVPGPHLLISINPTGADGTPTVSPLASGVYDAGNITLDYGPEFVQFSSLATLQKGQKYWIEIHPIDSNYLISSLAYLSSAPSVPFNSSAVVSNNNGLTWKAISKTTALDSEYLLETPPVEPPQYDTQNLFNDLSANHDFSVSSGPLRGWNAYVQASELSTFSGVAQWLSNFTGREFEFDTNAQVNVVNQLNLRNIVVLPTTNSTSTCKELLTEEESAIALGDSQLTYAPLSMLQKCSSDGIGGLAQQLNYVPYVGKDFGLGTSNSVLVVGDQSAANLTSYLSSAFNATYVNLSLNPSLKVGGDLSSFKAILWVSSNNETISSTVSSLLSRYVQKGGELVTTDTSLANLSAFTPKVKEGASGSSLLSASSFLRTALLHTGYASESFHQTITNSTLLARSPNLLLSAVVLGLGKIVFIGFGNASITQISDPLVVVSNILSNAVGVQPPIWYETTDSQASSTVVYSVEGTRGSPLLVWVYNPTSSASAVTLDLNGSYYGLPSSWKTVGLPGPSVALGSGTNVRIQTKIPPEALIGILVVPRSEPLISYSSGLVQTQFAYPNQALYSIAGTYDQSILFMISTNESVNQILLNDRTSLPQTSSAGQLYNATSGWYFDGNSDSLFVKYESTGVDTLRFIFYIPVSSPPVFPQQTVITIFEASIAIEAATLAFLAFRGRRQELRRRSAGNPGAA
jgi:hypothetical protein